MISLDFYFAVSFFMFIFMAAALTSWLFSRRGKDKDLSLDPRFIWFCSVCTYSYINTKEDAMSVCPRCGSYNKKA